MKEESVADRAAKQAEKEGNKKTAEMIRKAAEDAKKNSPKKE